MGQIASVVSDPAGIREFDCLLPRDLRVGSIARELAELAHFPLLGPDSCPLDYGLIAMGRGALDPNATLDQAGVGEPLRAVLVPLIVIRGGGLCDDDLSTKPASADPARGSGSVELLGEPRSLIHDGNLDLRLDVRITADAHREIERFAAADRHIECAGLLLGEVLDEGDERVVQITHVVPASEAPGSRTSVELNLEAWDGMLGDHALRSPSLRVLGWFHTHAGWGVFLSDADVFLHRHFFPHPNMVAYVLDPTTGRDAFFSWHNGVIGVCPSFALVGTRDQIERLASARKPRRVRKRVIAALAALSAMVCFAVAGPRMISNQPPPQPPVRKTVSPPKPPKPAQPQVRVYVIGKRDNLWLVCNRVYGDGDLAEALARYNGVSDYAGLQVGQRIKLPSREELIKFSETRPLPLE